MKRKCYNWICAICCIGLVGCSDFLEESSQDEVRPSTVEDLEQLLLGEGYLRGGDVASYLELLTDNVQCGFSENERDLSYLEKGASAFTWAVDMFEKMKEDGVGWSNSWQDLYSKIKGCNVVLDMLEQVTGSEDKKLNQRGQALALRASYYFMLVSLFAQPYNAEGIDVETALGVPLILESAVKDEFPPRENLAKCYQQIEQDLLEAVDLLDRYGQDNINVKVTPLFAYNLLSRLYLYMEQWDKAATYASVVIERNPQLRRLSDFYRYVDDPWGISPPTLTYDKEGAGVYVTDSPEMIYGYSTPNVYSVFYTSPDILSYPGSYPRFFVSDDLVELYESKDMRSEFFYQNYLISLFPMVSGYLHGQKYGGASTNNFTSAKGMRVAEAYLNRAEANIRLFMENGNNELRISALNDLNYLREHRFETPYEDVDITDADELLDFCLKERRRELAFEDHRWFDLRRLGMPEIVHKIFYTQEGQEVVLPQGSKRYVLPIPLEVLERNPALIQNPSE